MIFDAAASAGNTTMDLFGTLVSEPAPDGSQPAALVYSFSAAMAPPDPGVAQLAEIVVEEAPFSALFEEAGAGVEAEVSGSEERDDHEFKEPGPMLKSSIETVAPETLRMIFPVHYFYTDVQVREAADVEMARPVEEAPRARVNSSGPMMAVSAMGIAPVPAREPAEVDATADAMEDAPAAGRVAAETVEGPVEAPVEGLVGEVVAQVVEKPARAESPAPRGMVEPAPKLGIEKPDARREGVEASKSEARRVPVHGAEPPPPMPREIASEPAAPEKGNERGESPEASHVPVRAESRSKEKGSGEGGDDGSYGRSEGRLNDSRTGVLDSSRNSDGEHDGMERDSEPMVAVAKTAKVEAPRKEERSDGKGFGVHMEERAATMDAPEPTARPVTSAPRDSAEPAARRSEAAAPAQSPAKILAEPAAPATAARSVSIAVAGPKGEDVRAVVQATGDGVQVRLQAGDERTQQALQQGAPELQQRLEEVQRVPAGDVWEGTQRGVEAVADAHAPNAGFGGQQEPNQRDSSPSREDTGGGQRQGQRGFGRGGRERDAEASEEEFASHFEQGGKP